MIREVHPAGERAVGRRLEVGATDEGRVDPGTGSVGVGCGNGDGTAIGIPAFDPVGAHIGRGGEELAVSSVENVEVAVAIGLHQEFAILAVPHAVDQDEVFGGIPVARIVRRELIVPFELAGIGVDGKDGTGVEVVAHAHFAVDIGTGVAYGPIEGIEIGIVTAGEPHAAGAVFPAIAGPCFVAGLARRGDSVEMPELPAGGGIVGFKETDDAVFTTGDAGDDFIFQGEGGGGQAVAEHGIGNLDFPEERTGAGVEGDKRGIEGAEEDAAIENGDTAIKAIGLIGIDLFLRPLVLPDLATGGGVERVDLTDGAAGIHDAIDDEGSRFERAIAGHLHGPFGLQIFDVERVDLRERRVVGAFIIAPVGEPVLRFSGCLEDAIGCEDRSWRGRRGEGLQIGDYVGDIGCGEALRVVGRHDRGGIDPDGSELRFCEAVDLIGCVEQLDGEGIVIATETFVFVAVFGFHGDDGLLPGVQDSVAQLLGGPEADAREVGLVAGAALGVKGGAPDCGVAGDGIGRSGARETAQVGHDLPDLIGCELGEGRHLGPLDAAAHVAEDFGIGVAMAERAGEAGGAITTGFGAVAGLADGGEELLACVDGGRVAVEGVLHGIRDGLGRGGQGQGQGEGRQARQVCETAERGYRRVPSRPRHCADGRKSFGVGAKLSDWNESRQG